MSRILPYLTQQQEFPINDRLEVGQSISQLVNKSVSHWASRLIVSPSQHIWSCHLFGTALLLSLYDVLYTTYSPLICDIHSSSLLFSCSPIAPLNSFQYLLTTSQSIVWQILALATALGWLTHIEGFDFESIWDRVVKHVRDDNYLVGRKLQNREAAPAAAVPVRWDKPFNVLCIWVPFVSQHKDLFFYSLNHMYSLLFWEVRKTFKFSLLSYLATLGCLSSPLWLFSRFAYLSVLECKTAIFFRR